MAKKIEWHTEKRKLKDLIPWERNPRLLSKEQAENLKKSLAKFGIVEPPAINVDNTIIGGHQRSKVLALMKSYGDDAEIDVRVPNRPLTDREVEELNLRLNKNTGSFDFYALQTDFALDDLMEWGFKPFELGLPDENPEPEELWEGMPEFQREPAVKRDGGQCIVHFATMEDRADFAKKIGQQVTPTTRYIWHPEKEARVVQDYAFVDSDEFDDLEDF